jgi:ADP-ribose pyrophosphatase
MADSPSGPREVFRGRRLWVETLERDGHTFELVRGPSAVAVVALTRDGELILVRQYRPAIGQDLIEIPAGLLDVPGEPAEACAERELLEETGYRASSPRWLGRFFSSAGMADEAFEVFVCGADLDPAAVLDGEVDDVALVPWFEALERARAGGFADSKTNLAILLADAAGIAPSR